MASTTTTVIAAAALAVSGCAVGLLLGRWTFTPATAAERAVDPPAPTDLAPLLAELRRLNEAVLEEPRERGSTQVQPVSAREVAAPSSDVLTRIAAAVERTNELLQRADGERQAHRTAQVRLMGAGFPSLDALFDRMQQLSSSGDPEWRNKVSVEFRTLHMAWTRDDVFERYGAPGSILGGELGVSLVYVRTTDPTSPQSVIFLTSEGLVTGVST